MQLNDKDRVNETRVKKLRMILDMASIKVIFAPHLQRHVPCPAQMVNAATLRDALDSALLTAPALRHYVFDEQQHIRKHVAVFINGALIRDRIRLDVALNDDDRVDVIQALSGG
jgi:sulfur-carrier protein